MGKIGVASCYFQKNYGSILQAYATQRILDELGIDNEAICVSGIIKAINTSKLKFYIRNFTNFHVFRGKFGYVKFFFYRKLKRGTLGKQIAMRNVKFDEFSKNKIKISKEYSTRNELTEGCKNYSAVLIGSDQLWTPANIDADFYTLTFVPDNVLKISYATSFGISSLPNNQIEKAKKFLSRINYISVREQSGQRLVKELTCRDVQVVCDPTLLFSAEQWMNIQKPERIIKDKYIFCYFLGNNPDQRDFAKHLKLETGFKIVALQHLDEYIKSDQGFADIAPYNIGPSEFVNLVRNAEYVCTDSFHGSVFSILYSKNFFTFRRFKEASALSTNTRIESLFGLLGLNDRFLSANEDIVACMNKKIDYDAAHKKLDAFRCESKQYLIHALKAIKGIVLYDQCV